MEYVKNEPYVDILLLEDEDLRQLESGSIISLPELNVRLRKFFGTTEPFVLRSSCKCRTVDTIPEDTWIENRKCIKCGWIIHTEIK